MFQITYRWGDSQLSKNLSHLFPPNEKYLSNMATGTISTKSSIKVDFVLYVRYISEKLCKESVCTRKKETLSEFYYTFIKNIF